MIKPILLKPAFEDEDFDLFFLVRHARAPSLKTKAIILLHGVGSNEQDLFDMAEHFPDDFLVIAPRGPLTLQNSRYAWYEVDFSTGKPVFNCVQEKQSRSILIGFISKLKNLYHIDEIYLGGFSQGAIMSYTIGLTRPYLVKGILALSGRILEEIKPAIQKTSLLQQLRVFIGHGEKDGTLPVCYAQEAKIFLEDLGLQPDYQVYDMGHQVIGWEIQDFVEWLKLA